MNFYLQQRTLFPPLIQSKPSPNLGIVVVIPTYDEAYLLFSLMSLKKCDLPNCDVEVIVIINDAENEKESIKINNRKTNEQAVQWAQKNNESRLKFHILYHDDLNAKHAGVGLARKIGMDEACWRYEKYGSKNGIIACFDADSRCDPNYFKALENHFERHPETQAVSIYFEHPLEGIDFDDAVYNAIIDYELHLRYYIEAQQFAGFPFACQTIGSSMAVTSFAYQMQGGMNRRKAGEDFYFIHKFTPLGHFSEITSTRVIPSPRPSHRVPFGTGKAVGEMVKKKEAYQSYNPKSFEDLKIHFQSVSNLFLLKKEAIETYLQTMPKSIQQFLTKQNFVQKLLEFQSNTTNISNFENRYFRWFNAFLLMKYLHFARDEFYPNLPVKEAAVWLLRNLHLKNKKNWEALSEKELLLEYRKIALKINVQS